MKFSLCSHLKGYWKYLWVYLFFLGTRIIKGHRRENLLGELKKKNTVQIQTPFLKGGLYFRQRGALEAIVHSLRSLGRTKLRTTVYIEYF